MKFSYFIAIIIFSVSVIKADELDVVKQLQSTSVTIRAKNSEGSGVIKTRVLTNNNKEETVSYIWTAAHVTAGLRKTRTVIDGKSGATKTVVEFDDAQIIQELTEEGRRVGEIKMDAEVLRYSDADSNEDLCLLRVRKRNFVNKDVSVKFYLEDNIPPVGTELYHCGSLLGQLGANSLTTGLISQHGRVLPNGKIFDQSSAVAFPGSSGGQLSTKKDGKCVGLLVRGAGEGFNLYVPIRRIKIWAKKVGVEFALDDNVPVPSDDELKKYPLEDLNFASKTDEKTSGDTKFLIRELQKIDIND